MNRRTRSDHGLSTFAVVGLMGLVAMTLLAVGQFFTTQAQRTQRYTAEAQVRQLLLAGADLVRQNPPVTGDVPLPPDLPDAALTIDREGDAFIITATLGRHTGRQRVTLADTPTGRVVTDASLEMLP